MSMYEVKRFSQKTFFYRLFIFFCIFWYSFGLFLFLDFFGFKNFLIFFLFFWFLWIPYKVTKNTTKSYHGYYWKPKMEKNSIIR